MKLPLDDTLSRFGQHVVSRCNCCVSSHSETIYHVFVEGEIANRVWNYYANHLSVKNLSNTLRQVLRNWWAHDSKNAL